MGPNWLRGVRAWTRLGVPWRALSACYKRGDKGDALARKCHEMCCDISMVRNFARCWSLKSTALQGAEG